MRITLIDPDIVAQIRTIPIGPFELHTYGLILGVALVIGIWIFLRLTPEKVRASLHIPVEFIIFILVISALVGGRLAFVLISPASFITDPMSILYIWEGGMTIFGIIIGGFIGYSLCWVFFIKPSQGYFTIPDVGVIALAAGQAVGRWGNYVNEELYGFPSDDTLSIYISPGNRLPGYEHFDYFHPAFLYESLAMAAVTGTLYLLLKLSGNKTIGTGFLTGLYLLLYGSVRLMMERIRIDQPAVAGPFKPADLAGIALILVGTGIILYAEKTKDIRRS
jgi:phosphatidylglycerol---prolipoprotein diacylglyceryl transferase